MSTERTDRGGRTGRNAVPFAAEMHDRLESRAPVAALSGRHDAAFGLFALLQSQGASLDRQHVRAGAVRGGARDAAGVGFPHRADWRPPGGEIKTDLVFMDVVQLALPPLWAFCSPTRLSSRRARSTCRSRLWPHGWPIWIQAMLMVLVVDFLRYWLHRARTRTTRCGGCTRSIIRWSSCTGSTPRAFIRSRRRCRCPSTACRSC